MTSPASRMLFSLIRRVLAQRSGPRIYHDRLSPLPIHFAYCVYLEQQGRVNWIHAHACFPHRSYRCCMRLSVPQAITPPTLSRGMAI